MNGKTLTRFAGIAILFLMTVPAILQAASTRADSPEEALPASDTVQPSASSWLSARAFLLMPRQDLDILPISVRQDMIDYLDADSLVSVPNVYMGLSKIEEATPDYMRVRLTDASSIQFKILQSEKLKQPIVMTIYTVGADNDTSDSTIKFFSFSSADAMTELERKKFFSLPDPKLFFNIPRQSELTAKDIEEIMPFYTVEYTARAGSSDLSGRLTMSDYLTTEQLQKIQPLLRPELSWSWDGKKFKLNP